MSASPRSPWMLPFALGVIVGTVLFVGGMAFFGLAESMRGKGLPKPNPEAEVRALLDAQAEAWNRGDLDGFMAGYWESEELRFASGDKVKNGFAATKAGYFKRYKAEGKEMGKLTFSEVTVEMLTPELALVRGRWRLKFDKEKDEPHGLYTLTVKRLPEGWRVTSDHTSAAEKE